MKEKISAPARLLHLFIAVALTSSLLSFISVPANAVPPETCANGGPCQPGDIGPGGGLVFYVSTTPFKCGPNHADDCTYLEVAPKSWSGNTPDAAYYWNSNAREVKGISRDASPNMGEDQLGLGLKNSHLMAAADPSAGNAGVAARGYVSPSKSDWYLPTIAELGILCQYAHGQTPVTGSECDYSQNLNTRIPSEFEFLATSYQSSSQSFNQGEDSRSNAQWHQNFVLGADGNSAQQSTYGWALDPIATRPIRAFAIGVTLNNQIVQCGSSNGTFSIVNKEVVSSTPDCSGDITIPYGVTSIGYTAFWLKGITSVSIPNTVVTIGDSAFRQTSMTSVSIPGNVESIGYLAFGTTFLEELIIPANSNLTSIGSEAFQSSRFDSVTVPATLTSIGDRAFQYNNNLTLIKFADVIPSIPMGWPWSAPESVLLSGKVSCGTTGHFTISESILTGRYNCTGSVVIPNGVTSIAEQALDADLYYNRLGYAIYGNKENSWIQTSITSLTIPNSVTSIGDYAFRSLSVTSLTIPNSVTSIGRDAFDGGSAIETLTISNGLASIPLFAFKGLTRLTSLDLGNGVMTLGSDSFLNSGTLTYFRYCGFGVLDLDAAGLGSQIAPSCILTNEVNGVAFEISSELPINEDNFIHLRLSDINLIDSLTVTAMSGGNALTVTPEFLNCGTDFTTFKSCLNAVGAQYQITYRASDGNDPDLASITFTVQSVPDYAPEITYRQPIYKGRSEPEVQIDTAHPYTFLSIGGQESVITHSDTETVNGLFENNRYRIDTGETGLKVKQIWTTADADTHINFHDLAPNSGTVTVTIKAGAFNAAYPAYVSNSLVIPVNGCDGITALCIEGDIGPGGGTIFYVESDAAGFASAAPECSPRCRYLEAAPTSGFNSWSDLNGSEGFIWHRVTSSFNGITDEAIGSGYSNTYQMIEIEESASGAALAANNYNGGWKEDWFLPSIRELELIVAEDDLLGTDGYWSSSEPSCVEGINVECISRAQSSAGSAGAFESGDNPKSEKLKVRPIRAFGYVTPAAILGVTAPVRDAVPVDTVTVGNGYTGTITWASDAGALVGNFQPGTIYTATITLTSIKTGYSFGAIAADYFTVAGATATNPFNSGIVMAVFSSTGTSSPALIEIVDGNNQIGRAGQFVDTSPSIRVMDAEGNPVPGVQVEAEANGEILDANDQPTDIFFTDADGIATFPKWRLPPTLGATNMGATVTGASNLVVTFSATVIPGFPSQIFLEIPAAGALDERPFITQPRILIRDVPGNTVTSDGSIGYYINLGDETVSFGTIDYFAGVASASNIEFNGTPGMTYTISYSSEGLIATSQTIYLGKACNGVTIPCLIGDMGPGGGIVFYIDSSANGFTSDSPGCSAGCRYLEAAIHSGPDGWDDMGPNDGGYLWSENTNTSFGTTLNNIGSGYANTTATVASDAADIVTANTIARSYRGGGKDDWYLPSLIESEKLYNNKEIVGLLPILYWTSTEESATRAFDSYDEAGTTSKNGSAYARAVRAIAGPRPACYTVVNRIVTSSQNCSGMIEIPNDIIAIANDALLDADSVSELIIGNGVITIGANAFRGLYDLTDLTLGSSIQTISADAFRNATSLRALVIPDSVITIGNRAFGSASSLVSLTIGRNVESIGEETFYGADSLLSYTYCGSLLTDEDLADAGLGGKERLACPQAPATNQVSSPTPNPRQQSKVFAINPTSAVSLSTIPVTITGEFVETVVNIAINGTSLPVGAWKQTRNEISFLMPSKKVGTYLIQLYNGSSPLLEPIAFIFTLTPEVKPESPAIDVSNKPDSEKSQGSGVTTNLTGPESKKPLQNILTTKIYFDMGSSAINLLNRKNLQNFAKRIAGLGTSISVSVKGFAQPTPGSQKTDQALSKKRASNVAQLLRNFGVNTRVTYAGAGRALLNVPKSRYVEIIAANK